MPADVLAQLRQRREARTVVDALQDEVEREHDAFLLDPGLGPMTYLTSDGRVLLDFRGIEDGAPLREAEEDDAIASLVVGARKTGIEALLELVPRMPAGGSSCIACHGTRWMALTPGGGADVVCLRCRGRGWRAG